MFALETLATGSDRSPSSAHALRRGINWTAAATLVAVVVAGAGGVWWTMLRDRPVLRLATAADARPLLAVLPFENISRNGEGYFAAGLTEEVTGQLSKLSGLRVVARTAVAQFKDPHRQLSEMAKELGIGSVVTGTVREDGARVRVNVELINAQSGQLIWSEQYDHALPDGSGLALLEWVRSQAAPKRGIPAIVVTGVGTRADEVRAQRLGVIIFLNKSFRYLWARGRDQLSRRHPHVVIRLGWLGFHRRDLLLGEGGSGDLNLEPKVPLEVLLRLDNRDHLRAFGIRVL